ncbi:transposase [Gordonia sp. Swx-4]|uniref:IS110 family transposase n=1 Tax=Gordonia sp. Swx-4 TaxID=3029399 RepID=UPI002572C76D|nr:transposase [Gordonia sp. Swx-4]WJG13541.1 transposase [Gordonia sp. Swx-4]WJG15514.1 transposase [Gordonia sp. Swx-4]
MPNDDCRYLVHPIDRSPQLIVIGVDAHKSTHTFVAVDEVGRKLAELTAKATTDGHLSAIEWATQWPQLQFALEDCRHVTRRLEADLLNRGHAVVRVKTQLMALHRRSAREPGKSDPIDAHAVAMAALREPNLPIARLDGPAREVKLLSDHRHDLVCERTKLISRLRWHLHELDPELHVPLRGIRHYRVMDEPRRPAYAFHRRGCPDRWRTPQPMPADDPPDQRPRTPDPRPRPGSGSVVARNSRLWGSFRGGHHR